MNRTYYFLFYFLLIGCDSYTVKVATNESTIHQYYGNIFGKSKTKELGHIYPGFPILVRSEKLPEGNDVDRLFGDMFGYQVFAFATDLRSYEPEMQFYYLSYSSDIKREHPVYFFPLKMIFFDEKALLYGKGQIRKKIDVKYKGKKMKEIPADEREYPFEHYWICNYISTKDSMTFSSCLAGDRRNQEAADPRTSFYYPFVPIVEDLSKDDEFSIQCNKMINSEKIVCDVNEKAMYGLPLSKSEWWRNWP
ncbi:hypothetical protein EHQ52_14910 [Leptospira koniambonensis]|uniref:Lipoprotein n=1 Tax=Leptospira koniambonensis TaxID=2484950 RepID=A0A4R9J6S3_9LEPT|nr:hypothetical protein [Leptospira koniambonensis]TGL32570.1 hypothetical protein EHQ52_14910 [Leptospira koniambonensis]